MISELPARSYQSVTVPSGKSTPATQNVLGIDNFSGPRVGVTALLNIYIPDIPLKHGNRIPLNGRNWGLALSGGPTYAVSGNSADTSQWGLLFGPTVHIRNQFFVTPGVNIGQFADFPLGYTRAGQIIPANTGTPNPVKRYTARFAVGVTYKIKDFGQGTGQNNAGAAPQAGAANASGGNTKGSGPDKPATQAGNSY